MTVFLQAQMDYIFFVYGLSFVVLGVICFAFFNEDEKGGIKLPTHFFGLFALLHGFNEWLDLIAMDVFESRTFVIVRLVFMALSFLFLFEFARRSAVSGAWQEESNRKEEPRSPIFGYWIYFPLLLFAASGAWFGIAEANATVRYFIGLSSALFSGWIFYQASKREPDENRQYLFVMGIALGIYGILAGLVVPASQLPLARWINNDSFMKFTGAPVQLFRALCASIISIVFVYYHLNVKRKDLFRFIKGSRRALIVSSFIAGIAFIVIAGWFVTDYIGAHGERHTAKEDIFKSEIFLEHLNNEMQRVDQSVTAMALSPHLASAMSTKQMETLNEIIDRFQSAMKVDVCYLLDGKGTTVAASNRNARDSFVGKSYDFRPYFQQAIIGSQGRYLALGKISLERGYFSSFPVRNKNGIIIGAAVIKKNILAIETSFHQYQYAFMTSPEGIIFISSSPAYLFKSLWPVDDKTRAGLLASRQFGDLTFETVLDNEPPDGSYVTFLGKQFIVSRRPVGMPGWSLIIFGNPMDRSLYRMAGIVAMFTVAVFIIAVFYVLMKTERMRETAERLARLNQEYRFLVDSSSDFIFRNDLHAGLTYVSPSVEAITGRSQQEWMAHYSEYLTDNPGNGKAIEYLGSAPVSGNEMRLYEAELHHKDGSKIILEIREHPIEVDGKAAGTIGNAREITERKKAEDALQEAGEFNRQVIESVQEGIIVYGPDLKYKSWNSFMERLTGLPAAEVLGRHPLEVFPFLLEAGVMAVIEKALAGEVSEREPFQFHVPKTGRSGWASEISAPLKNARGEIIGVIGTVRDITEHRKLEDQLRHSQKMEAVGTLAGGIAHDFNNILNVIMGYGVMVMNTLEPDTPSKEQMNEVLIAADRAANLTKRLLVFSRKQVVEVKPVNINTLILDLRKMLVRIISENIEFILELADRSLIVLADAGQLEQVLINLAGNARDAMPEGGRLTISTGFKELDDAYVATYGYGKPGRYALITVADTGQGMDAEIQKKIFEPFFTTKGIGEGTGLGLAISYGIIKQHSGNIQVYSEPGQGTVFKIYLPLSEEATAPDKKMEVDDPVKGGHETILVAEDDASLRKLTRIMLESFGYTVISAEDGEETITKFMENREKISLVLLDMIMPKKNGKEVSEALRNASPRLKILFASGYTMDIIKTRELTEAGFDFIQKPVLPRDLLIKVREVLDR